ncbi:hypothetical protein BU14_1599s0003 [Porphyra umbilicalis]|uniref:Uncharacterized protein n=1 Tax=Porphyra umbilicalis TaxID=2786 RepID=A0A1X6NL34_PORUM|nr:hypothetical protein BU14_1599s0003 [Porphyra umbilicalis]|eukprot:OSX69351.1 hypothetical protein BU14_1599s0003 [Porphyra umbilicalis]
MMGTTMRLLWPPRRPLRRRPPGPPPLAASSTWTRTCCHPHHHRAPVGRPAAPAPPTTWRSWRWLPRPARRPGGIRARRPMRRLWPSRPPPRTSMACSRRAATRVARRRYRATPPAPPRQYRGSASPGAATACARRVRSARWPLGWMTARQRRRGGARSGTPRPRRPPLATTRR